MNELEQETFGELVKRNRKSRGLTQTELATQVGCATISVRKIESGSLRASTQLAELLADMLDVPDEERKDFIKLARSVNNGTVTLESDSENLTALKEGNKNVTPWQHTENILALMPLFLLVAILIISPSYISALVAIKQPFIIVNILPMGWVILAMIVGLMLLSKVVLQQGRRKLGKQQVYIRAGLQGFVLLFITFPAMMLVLVAPWMFLLMRSGALDPK